MGGARDRYPDSTRCLAHDRCRFPLEATFAVGLADTIEGLTNIAHDGIDEDFHRDETPPSRKTGSAGPMRTPLGTDVSGVTPGAEPYAAGCCIGALWSAKRRSYLEDKLQQGEP